MGDYTYNLTLWVKHSDADLSDVPLRLGLPARRLWRKGDIRVAPNGRVQGGVHPHSYCGIPIGENQQRDLPKGLRNALDLLKPHALYLDELWRKGVDVRFFVGWFSDFNSGDCFDWEILRDMAQLHISLDLDFYAPDKAEE